MNKFAVTGCVLDLMLFERELLNLDFENVNKNVFEYRGQYGNPALYISVHLHADCKKPMQYTPCMNDGNAEENNCLLKLPADFENALLLAKKIADEFGPITTEDGYKVNSGEKVFHVGYNFIKQPLIISNRKSMGTVSGFKIFKSEKNADVYIYNNEKKYTQKELDDKINHVRGCWKKAPTDTHF